MRMSSSAALLETLRIRPQQSPIFLSLSLENAQQSYSMQILLSVSGTFSLIRLVLQEVRCQSAV